MINRRKLLAGATGVATLGVTAGAGMLSTTTYSATLPGYRALVVVHLNGGSDGNDVLVPLDGAYSDYTKSRPSIALGAASLMPFASSHLEHKLGLNRALAGLMPLFDRQRVAFLVNAGPLIQPSTAADVLNDRVKLPPFLYSHPEQTNYVQGWMGDEDPSGWGGRGMEAMGSASMKAPLVSVDGSPATLVLGQRSRKSALNSRNSSRMGQAVLTDPTNVWTQAYAALTRVQSQTAVENEYAATFRAAFADAQEIANADPKVPDPAATFADNDIARQLRAVAKFLPYYKSVGASRQILQITWGDFDTHVNQRGADAGGRADLDSQLAMLSNAIVAFDSSMVSAGMGEEVMVLVVSEFGRTLDPAAGLGSDHAWGNHWFAVGGPVKGGRMYGVTFPRLILKGPDDGDKGGRGYWVPQLASDQVAADALLWLGLSPSSLDTVMPNLRNFSKKTAGYLNA